MSLETNNQKDFYQQVSMNDDHEVEMEVTTLVGTPTPAISQYEFFKRINLTDDGKISVVIV